VRVEFDLAPNLPMVHVDSLQIGQVVFNLVSNALQAMEDETREAILTLRGRHEERIVRLDVQDTGRGIKPEHVSRIFEPLFTTRARGIGLGLALSRSLAEANGGSLTVSSQFGRGATFTLIVPAVI
jgi:signal transduction histidine kinase